MMKVFTYYLPDMVRYRISFIAIVFFLISILPARGQGFRAGIIAGISATQISGDDLGGFDKAGLVAGGMVSTNISKKLDLAMEITFFQKGSKKNADPKTEITTPIICG
jgi:hypothetical protein